MPTHEESSHETIEHRHTGTTTMTTTAASNPLTCPQCGGPGKPVKPVTLRALLRKESAPGVEDVAYGFCDAAGCDVVYFSDGRIFTKTQLKVPVGVKETGGERPLCYCFGHSVATIREELRTKGHSDARQDIRAKMNDPGCRCETENPSGSCCLASVGKGIRIARKELEMTDTELETTAAPAGPAGNRGGKIAGIGTVASAIMASACCWLPLLLLAVGVSGAGIAATLEAYRPLFIVVTFGFLGAAFYFTYRPKRAAAAAGEDRCAPEATGGDCCLPSGKGRLNMMTMNRVMLWVVTGLAVAFLFFPGYVGVLFGTGSETGVTGNMNRALFQIEGMTCEGCAATVARAIHQVPGVLAVEVSYEKKQAVVGAEAGSPVPQAKILAALKNAGYNGQVLPGRRERKRQAEDKRTTMLIDLSDDARRFRETFNAAKGNVRIVMIVSPG